MRTNCVLCAHPKAEHPRPSCSTFATMDLPEGKTCADCYAVRHCTALYGVKTTDTKCDFWPVRFREPAASQASA